MQFLDSKFLKKIIIYLKKLKLNNDINDKVYMI